MTYLSFGNLKLRESSSPMLSFTLFSLSLAALRRISVSQ